MKKHSKRYNLAREKITGKAGDKPGNQVYEIEEVLARLKEMPPAKFDQTVEITINLGIDPKKTEQMVRGAVVLPRGIGKSRKVIVFAAGEEAQAAKTAGADEVGAEELIKKISDGWIDFDVAIAPPYMMKTVSKLGKILGPAGKMPSPKNGTVTADITNAVKEFKAGKVEYRSDTGGVIHAPIGKLSFSISDLAQNTQAFLDHIQGNRPPTAKGIFISRATISATMSPGLRIKLK